MNDILITCAGEKHGSVLSAMTLGTKSLMDEETKDLYSRNGLSHITAISGMHIGVVGMCLFGVLRKLFGVTPASFITGGAMLLYGIITGASVSCVRAVVMFLVKLGGIVTGRRYSPSVSVAVSMVLILLGNPCYIYNSSFIMSYAAIISVLIIFPVVNYHIKNMIKRSRYAYIKNLKKSVAAVVGSLCLNVVMLPLMSFYFYKVPVYSVLINILVVPLMSMVLFSSIICCGLYCFLGGTAGYAEMIGTGVVMVGKVLLIVFEKLCNIFEFLPFNIYVSGKPQIGEVLFFYGTVAVIIILLWAIRVYMRRKQLTMDRVFGRVVLSAVALMLFISVRNILVNKHVTGNGLFISFIDVGQGDCVFIRDSKGVTYLYDCGSSDEECVGKYMVVPHLRSLGVDNIDYVIVSHGDTDHVSGIKEMLSDRYLMDIGCLIVGKLQAQSDAVRELVALAEKKDIRVVYAGKGFVIRSGELFLECIGPAAENKRIATTEAVESSNESSLVMVCTYKDFKLILTGDIGAETEKILLEDKNIADKIANADVLKVAHHGSAYSSSAEFLDKVLPQVAVISCGIDNSYGHPASIVVDRLLRNEAKLFLTMESGTIWMKEVEGKIVVGRYRK